MLKLRLLGSDAPTRKLCFDLGEHHKSRSAGQNGGNFKITDMADISGSILLDPNVEVVGGVSETEESRGLVGLPERLILKSEVWLRVTNCRGVLCS